MIEFRIGGRKVRPENIADAIQATMLEAIKEDLHRKIGSIRDPKTGEAPVVVVTGPDLERLSVKVEGSADVVAAVKERLGLDSDDPLTPEYSGDTGQTLVFLSHGGEEKDVARRLGQDLQQRGMLEDTLVLCTTEFGRSPYTQAEADVVGRGRDHNEHGFSVWMAGGGLRAGLAYGATDAFGHHAVEQRVTWPDLHATVLHLFGIDHERLTHYHDGISRRLTNVHGRVVRGVLA